MYRQPFVNMSNARCCYVVHPQKDEAEVFTELKHWALSVGVAADEQLWALWNDNTCWRYPRQSTNASILYADQGHTDHKQERANWGYLVKQAHTSHTTRQLAQLQNKYLQKYQLTRNANIRSVFIQMNTTLTRRKDRQGNPAHLTPLTTRRKQSPPTDRRGKYVCKAFQENTFFGRQQSSSSADTRSYTEEPWRKEDWLLSNSPSHSTVLSTWTHHGSPEAQQDPDELP